jgi:hypothetical protein
MSKVNVLGRTFQNNDLGHLFVSNNQNKFVKLKLNGKKGIFSFDINVGDLKPVGNDAIEITGKKSGRKQIMPKDTILQVINFVDDPKSSSKSIKTDEATIEIIKESEIIKNLIKKVLKEQKTDRYMFFSNLEQMKRQCEYLLELDEEKIASILDNGHDWAQDHIAEAKNNMDQVFDFLMNETKTKKEESDESMVFEGEITEKKKKNTPTNPSLWQQSLAWARSRYKVCPSAYCNGAAAKRYKSKGGKWKKK